MTKKNITIASILLLILMIAIGIGIIFNISKSKIGLASLNLPQQQLLALKPHKVVEANLGQKLLSKPLLKDELKTLLAASADAKRSLHLDLLDKHKKLLALDKPYAKLASLKLTV